MWDISQLTNSCNGTYLGSGWVVPYVDVCEFLNEVIPKNALVVWLLMPRVAHIVKQLLVS
jgi:hypothetical protein